MRKWLFVLLGVTLGAVAVVVFLALFSPIRSETLRQTLGEHYQKALAMARTAGEEKRRQLEAELQAMREAGDESGE